jgi:carboxymethylenebutenolidase
MTNDWAIVVLPEIFGINGFVQSVVERLGREQGVPTVAVDFMHAATGTHAVYSYADMEGAHAIAQKVTNEMFMSAFKSAVDTVQAEHRQVIKIAVVGFCMGGRLAYLAGTDPRVEKVISFYGTRPSEAVAALAAARTNSSLKVLSFYGGTDISIPESDRDNTAHVLTEAGISCQAITYPDAGHAFMNHERSDRYHEASAEDATNELDTFLATD